MGSSVSIPINLKRNSSSAAPRARLISIEDVFAPTFGDYEIDTIPLAAQKLSSRQPIAKNDKVRALIGSTFKRNFLFSSLSDHQLENLIDICRPIKCLKGEKIIQEGLLHDFMYVF
mmetsp:Transcript_39650/g.51123  ORF Transcript_39650/g.51123 Transcript_39650/m.51123 type:complete len:116 (+) Transcript_39650:73-420(+)